MTNSYSLAVTAIREYAEAHQSKLDRDAAEALAELATKTKATIAGAMPVDSPAYPVLALLANTIEVKGRDVDGFPQIRIPQETGAVLRAALAANLLPSGIGDLELNFPFPENQEVYVALSQCCADANNAAHHSWRLAIDYRRAQTWKTL